MADAKTRRRLLNAESEDQEEETDKKVRGRGKKKGKAKKKRKRDRLVVLMILLVSVFVSLGFYLFSSNREKSGLGVGREAGDNFGSKGKLFDETGENKKGLFEPVVREF